MGKGFGTTALILGIISISVNWAMGLASITGVMPVFGWIIIPAIAIILGIIGIVIDDPKGRAIAGLILGIIGLIISYAITTLFAKLIP